ncbi:bifunctional oligoribonuclease/PAP phosphatase NrnA [Thermosipho ferrireducens]|uniref:Bifunctional oligoribonuclease/PAP phosphatase NrnA n=2 Tax=Thermosipho ferrireducens TaxID=2571116 RepID=A0ABX7SAL4_9BACT|nr:bifunctional oligoribonuclease/PAP phosphatase NrnA [Thermosipho ferrireducens]
MNEFLNIVAEINNAKKVLVLGHIMPDGDDISSVLSLTMGLEKLGKEVEAAIDWKIQSYFYELPEVQKIRNFEQVKNYDPDLIVIVDASSPDRIGQFAQLLEKYKVIVIDHHGTNTYFGNFNWVDTSFGATAQMVLRINKELGVKYNERLALINLMGIQTDTGFFRYANADERVFLDAAELIKFGASPNVISRMILENKKIEQFRLLATMVDHLKIDCDGLLAYSYLSSEDYAANNCTEEDSGGFVSEIRSIKGVEVAIFLSEYNPNEVHVSFRSKEWFDVSKVAVVLGGGGHPRAAGCTIEGDIKDILEEVVKITRVTLKSESLRGRSFGN